MRLMNFSITQNCPPYPLAFSSRIPEPQTTLSFSRSKNQRSLSFSRSPGFSRFPCPRSFQSLRSSLFPLKIAVSFQSSSPKRLLPLTATPLRSLSLSGSSPIQPIARALTPSQTWSAITGPIGKECADLWPRIASAANAIV